MKITEISNGSGILHATPGFTSVNSVTVNGVAATYTFDAGSGIIQITSAQVSGDTLVADVSYTIQSGMAVFAQYDPAGPRVLRDRATGKDYAIGAQGPITVLFPSGDTSGATDYANVSQYLVASVAADIYLREGDWYFNDTLVRMPRRNSNNTDWEFHTLIGRSTDALIPDFCGVAASLTRLHFTDITKPGMYIWRPPSGIAGGPALNVRSRANASDTSNDPLTVGGGKTCGFTIIGATTPYYTAGNYFSLDNESRWANHIGIAIWGALNVHEMEDVAITNFGTGLVLHDTTGLMWKHGSIRKCDIGLALGIQSDMNGFEGIWTETCRVGTAMVWDGWQTGSGTTATFAGIGRESNGSYIAYGGSDNDVNNFRLCAWVGCAMAALAGHANIANTNNVDMYGSVFTNCYWESNASIMYYFRNQFAGAFEFIGCNFRGLTSTDTVGAYTAGNLAAQTGPIQEILRHWIPGRFGVSQNTTDQNFGAFWGFGINSGEFVFKNSRMDAVVYPFILAKSNIIVRWEHNYSPYDGVTQYPTIAANITDANSKGCRVKTNDYRWMTANTQDWNDYFVQGGFAADARGVLTSVDTAVTLPAAAATYRGQNRTIIGAGGAADVTYQCMKSAADTYSWKAVATG